MEHFIYCDGDHSCLCAEWRRQDEAWKIIQREWPLPEPPSLEEARTDWAVPTADEKAAQARMQEKIRTAKDTIVARFLSRAD